MELNNLLFLLLLIFFGFFFNKYLLLTFKKSNSNLFSDNQFTKPQAFHENATYRLGGLTIFSLLAIVFLYLFFFKNIYFPEYISFSVLFFSLGMLDDLKINIRPKFRLLLMILFLMILVIFNEFYIEKTGLAFLNNMLEIDIFSLFFVCLCFLFIINGSNLVDGFNGLLGIHTFVIFVILFFINLIEGNRDIAYFLFFTTFVILIFLKFNFPNAQMFLGDSGSYLVGSLIAVSVVKTSILTPNIHPFFYCVLLFYLFFEVFFSFIRKLFFVRRSPLFPDDQHLHMLFYKLLLKVRKKKLSSNYFVSIYINIIYLFLITPVFFFTDNGLFCRYYFFLLLIIYIYFYKMLYRKVN